MSLLAKHDIGKVCSTCGERKPLDAFPNKTYDSGNEGKRFQCRLCYNAYMQRYKVDKRDQQKPVNPFDKWLYGPVRRAS